MNRWRQEFHYLDRPSVVVERPDLFSLTMEERKRLHGGVWRVDRPQPLLGPALSREEYEDGLRVQRVGRTWSVYEPIRKGA